MLLLDVRSLNNHHRVEVVAFLNIIHVEDHQQAFVLEHSELQILGLHTKILLGHGNRHKDLGLGVLILDVQWFFEAERIEARLNFHFSLGIFGQLATHRQTKIQRVERKPEANFRGGSHVTNEHGVRNLDADKAIGKGAFGVLGMRNGRRSSNFFAGLRIGQAVSFGASFLIAEINMQKDSLGKVTFLSRQLVATMVLVHLGFVEVIHKNLSVLARMRALVGSSDVIQLRVYTQRSRGRELEF